MLFLLVWILQLALIVIFVDSAWLQQQIATESRSVTDYLGAGTAAQLSAQTDAAFRSAFVNTEIIRHLHDYLIPNATVPKHGTDELAPWFFIWLEDSLRTFWLVMYLAIFRVLLFAVWTPYLGVLVLAALIDGLVHRKILKQNLGYANPVRYRAGMRALVVLLIAPLLYLTVPVNASPLIVPIWLLGLSVVLMVVAKNAQHRI